MQCNSDDSFAFAIFCFTTGFPNGETTNQMKHQESFDIARRIILQRGQFGRHEGSSDCLMRLSMKLLNVTPEQLPTNLKYDLMAWLGQAPKSIEGAIRPGQYLQLFANSIVFVLQVQDVDHP